MTNWVTAPSQATPGANVLVLKTEVLLPAYAGMTDEAIAAALTAQMEPDDNPLDMAMVRRKAIEVRVWGRIESFATRAFTGTAATQDLTNACRNFMALFREGQPVLLRPQAGVPAEKSALWGAMDADLLVMTGATGGGPVLTVPQADWMRALGDRTRPRWTGGVQPTDVSAARTTD